MIATTVHSIKSAMVVTDRCCRCDRDSLQSRVRTVHRCGSVVVVTAGDDRVGQVANTTAAAGDDSVTTTSGRRQHLLDVLVMSLCSEELRLELPVVEFGGFCGDASCCVGSRGETRSNRQSVLVTVFVVLVVVLVDILNYSVIDKLMIL